MSVTDLRPLVPDETSVQCDNCLWTGVAKETNAIKDLEQRCEPGSELLVGDAPIAVPWPIAPSKTAP